MKVAVAGQSSVGLDLAAMIAARGHETIGFDPDVSRAVELAQDLADMTHPVYATLASRNYRCVTTPDGIEGYEVGFVTPDEMIYGHPHITWDRFNVQVNGMGRALPENAVLLMHSVTLANEAMIRDAEALIRMTYRKETPKHYRLAWSLVEGGVASDPATQTLLVGALDKSSEDAAVQKLETMFGVVRRWSEVQPHIADAG